ncbi:MAG: dTDP-4-dehydrorhamnose 3,5-epimerase family protein, partial [Magnetococcus sp. WYHC-3]
LEDLREDSPTRGMRQEIVLRASEPHMLRVPSGVAHVLVNTGKDVASATVHSTEFYQPGHDIEHAVLSSAGTR